MRELRKRIVTTLLLALVLTAGNVGALAQQPEKRKARRPVVVHNGAAVAPESDVMIHSGQIRFRPDGEDTFVFVSSEMTLDGKVVKGAPYSAQIITENVQTLADGNRIVHKTTASIFRDSEGRTRREQTFGAIGPYAAAGEPPQTIVINDPVANISYILDPKSRTARKQSMIGEVARFAPPPPPPADDVAPARAPKTHRRNAGSVVVGRAGAAPHVFRYDNVESESKTESLGRQMIEGVEAEGTRTTSTIPAGAIGNELPINIVSEHWYSPELQTVVMTRHSDPRFGENTYRLTNINRSEPAASLFEVPGDYEIKEGMPRKMRVQIERELQRGRKAGDNEDEQ